jgi:hypothetical protein
MSGDGNRELRGDGDAADPRVLLVDDGYGRFVASSMDVADLTRP